MLTIYGLSIVLCFIKILYGSRKFPHLDFMHFGTIAIVVVLNYVAIILHFTFRNTIYNKYVKSRGRCSLIPCSFKASIPAKVRFKDTKSTSILLKLRRDKSKPQHQIVQNTTTQFYINLFKILINTMIPK